MKVRHAVFVALAAAVTLTSVAAAGPEAAKQRVAIDMKIAPKETFVLTPLQPSSDVNGDGQPDSVPSALGGSFAGPASTPRSLESGGAATQDSVGSGPRAKRASSPP
jgi:hypothetical protein